MLLPYISGVSKILTILTALSIYTEAGRPPECVWSRQNVSLTSSTRDGHRVSCRIRTLMPDYLDDASDRKSLTNIRDSNLITVLIFRCARQVVFASELKPSMFAMFDRLEELALLNCKFMEIPDYALAGLGNLRRLTIRSHHEDWPGRALKLGDYAFSDLRRLEILNLSFNSLWSLPKGTLCHLPSLTSLNLTRNSIQQIVDVGLSAAGGCSHPLSQLSLDQNELGEITSKALTGARNLRTLTLNRNQIVRIDDDAFHALFELRRLDLSCNRLVALPPLCFRDLEHLRDLDLHNNSIVSLPPMLFENLGHLWSLNLSYNQLDIPHVNHAPFKGLIRLVFLDLSHNQLTSLHPDTFRDLYSLQVLNLKNNMISQFSGSPFQGLSNVHTLTLSNNNLQNFTETAFDGLSVLMSLSLDHNIIENIHDNSFAACSSIQELNLSFNKLSSVPTAITKIKLLQTVNLGFNAITKISDFSFAGMSQLKKLLLHRNLLSTVSNKAFYQIPHLEELDFSMNRLSDLPNNTFTATKKLYSLNMTKNELTSFYGFIIHLHSLRHFNISDNKVMWFDYAMIPQNLEVLDISGNRITKLDNQYKLQTELHLKVLYAALNNLTEINSLSILDSMSEVHLEHNVIDYVASNTFKDKPNIELIDLRSNRLGILGEPSVRLRPNGNIAALRKLTEIFLSGNPLECHCEAEWLLRALNSGSSVGHTTTYLPLLGDLHSIECELPGIWDNKIVPILNVQPHQFLCTYRRHCFPVCHCCEFDACDCEQTCPKNCSCYHDNTWGQNIVDCGGKSWTKVPDGVPMDVTQAFMDGNNIGSLTSHSLIGKKNLKSLYLNSSQITNIQNQTFNGLKNLLILNLDYNLLEKLNGFEFAALGSLIELHINNNRLKSIANGTFSHLRSLTLLRLDNNQLTSFPVWNLALNHYLIEVSLFGNPWSCECSFLANMRAWLEANRIKTINGSYITCSHDGQKNSGPPILSDVPVRCDHYIASGNVRGLITDDYIMLIGISVIIMILVASGAVIVLIYRRRRKLCIFSKYSQQLFENSPYIEDKEKLFDAFISHSAKDTAWVCGLLAPELESRGFHLCVTHRDCIMQSGCFTSQAITDSMACSRRIILVLSRAFLDGEWCRYEYKSAHLEGLRNLKKKNLIVIFLEDLPKSEFDTELNSLLRTKSSYLYPKETKFWTKLVKALPSNRVRKQITGIGDSKALSRPLVEVQHETSTMPLKHTNHVSDPDARMRSLTVNPYWETAITTDKYNNWNAREPFLGKNNIPLPAILPEKVNNKAVEEHTYMSMSDCGDPSPSLPSGGTMSTTAGNSSSNSDSQPSRPLHQEQRSKNIRNEPLGAKPSFKIESPDYLTRSWIFHSQSESQPPPPGQTYFV